MTQSQQRALNYYCVKVPKTVSDDGAIYVSARRVEVTGSGALTMCGGSEQENDTVLVLASGQWIAVYAASYLDGSAVAIKQWKGEMANRLMDG